MSTTNTAIIDILTPELNFVDDILDCVSANCLFIDCITEWCETKGVEHEQIVPLIKNTQTIKAGITREAERLNCLKKKTNRLKI